MLTKWCARGMRNADIAAAKIVIAWLCSLQNDEVEKKEGGAEDKEKVKKGGDDRDFLRTIARRSLSLSLSAPIRATLSSFTRSQHSASALSRALLMFQDKYQIQSTMRSPLYFVGN